MKITNLTNLIYPKGFSCVNCGMEIFGDECLICDSCKKILPYLTGKLCLHCGEPITGQGKYCLRCKDLSFKCDKVVSPFIYDGIAKKFVVGLKYNNKKYYADCLAEYMAIAFKKELLPCDLVVCIPLCNKRLKERGYNQSELIAIPFAKGIEKEFDGTILERVKETPTQTKLTFEERQKNISKAFKVHNKQKVKDKIIVIVDDVYTTGATILECAKTLKQAGAKTVYGVTACHTIFKKNFETDND